MPRTPDTLGVLLPDVVAPTLSRGALPADLSPRARSARRIPKNYSNAEIDEARRVIDHWNATFADVDGASVAQKGNMKNVRAYTQMIRRCKDEGGPFASVDERTVKAAIDAYRADKGCVSIRRWKRFDPFCDPEIILQYAGQSKITHHRIEQPRREKKMESTLVDKAASILKDSIVFFVKQQSARFSIEQLLAAPRKPGSAMDKLCLRIQELMTRRETLDGPSRGELLQRARVIFDTFYRRPPKSDEDIRTISGTELALLDRIEKGNARPLGQMKAGAA